jgi:hypothetical protein
MRRPGACRAPGLVAEWARIATAAAAAAITSVCLAAPRSALQARSAMRDGDRQQAEYSRRRSFTAPRRRHHSPPQFSSPRPSPAFLCPWPAAPPAPVLPCLAPGGSHWPAAAALVKYALSSSGACLQGARARGAQCVLDAGGTVWRAQRPAHQHRPAVAAAQARSAPVHAALLDAPLLVKGEECHAREADRPQRGRLLADGPQVGAAGRPAGRCGWARLGAPGHLGS